MKSSAMLGRRAALVWVACYSWLVHVHAAGLGPFRQEVYAYDYESLAWAAAFGLMGGVFRTILSLMSEKVILLSIWRTMSRDLVFALIGGAAVYVLVEWLATVMPGVFGKELRMLAILVAGASRGRWQDFLAGAATDYTAGLRARLRTSPSVPSESPPPSVTAPFSDK
jgi:hypothetical protein